MNLREQIMNIPCERATLDWANTREAYQYGHRDARHAAAELALKADALAKELREVLEWASVEKAPLRDQEIASIKRVLAEYEAVDPRKLPKGKA